MEFENLKQVIAFLVSLNSRESTLKVNGKKATLSDLKEANYEVLVQICDLLGIEDVYLDEE